MRADAARMDGGRAAPRKAALRTAVLAWHRWFGLFAALWLALLAVTGSAITYYEEFDAWLNPELRRVATAAPAAAMPVEQAFARVREALPGFAPRQLQFPLEAGESAWMLGRAPLAGGPATVQVFLDPADGRVLGWRELGRLSPDRRHLMDAIYALHVDLAIGPAVTWFFGLVSLLWLLDHAAALFLSLPKLARWREAFGIRGARGSGRRLFDLHRAPGMWWLPVTAVLALTGVTLAWPDASRDAVRTIAPVSERLDFGFADVEVATPAVDADRALQLGLPHPGARLHSLRVLADKGAWAVRTFDPRDVDAQGRQWTYVAMDDGRILGRRHDVGEGAGDYFFALQYALHSGQYFGEPGRVVVFLSGFAVLSTCVTGVWLWWRRRRRPASPPRPA